MASYYVWSAAAGAANGTSWVNAYTTMALATASGKVAGDIFYIAHDHSESTAGNIVVGGLGSASNPIKVICVDRGGTVPPVSADRRATAQIATTVNNQITISGFGHYDGIIFVAGNSTGVAAIVPSSANGNINRFDNCSLRLGSSGNGFIQIGNAGSATPCVVELNNTTASFSGTGQGFSINATLKWRNTASALIGAQVPTILFNSVTSRGGRVECLGVDLSAAGSGKTLVGNTNTSGPYIHQFVDCKLNASVTKSAVPLSNGCADIDFVRCSATGNYSVFRHRISGTLDQETTIVRTSGGATDGVTPISWKVITTANCLYSLPFECPPVAIWNDTTGSAKTATIECIGAAVPNDDEVWIDLEYLGDASSPQGSFVNDGKANLLTTAAAQTSSAAAWGGSTAPFKLAVTFTAQQKGWVYARVKVGKASSTFYIDPLITLT